MREVVFRILVERPGHLTAQADDPSVRIEAPSLEELQHEAREALIHHLGAAHSSVRVRIRRETPRSSSVLRAPAQRPTCCP